MSIKRQQSNLKANLRKSSKNYTSGKVRNGARSRKNKEIRRQQMGGGLKNFNYNDGDNPKFNQETINEIKKITSIRRNLQQVRTPGAGANYLFKSTYGNFLPFYLRLWKDNEKCYLISISDTKKTLEEGKKEEEDKKEEEGKKEEKNVLSYYQYQEIPDSESLSDKQLRPKIMDALKKCGGNVGNNWNDAQELIDNYNNRPVEKPAETVSGDGQPVVPAESEDEQTVVSAESGDGSTGVPAVSGDEQPVVSTVSEDEQPVVSTVSGTGGKQRNKSKRNLKKISSKKRRPL